MDIYVFAGFLLWWLLWYFVFYYRFADRTLVHELRRSVKEAQSQAEQYRYELDEHLQQNVILRDKIQDLMRSNTDFSKMVSELSRYYYNIKMWAEKAHELSSYLKDPDPLMEERMKNFMHVSHEEEEMEKRFF